MCVTSATTSSSAKACRRRPANGSAKVPLTDLLAKTYYGNPVGLIPGDSIRRS